MFKEHHRNRSRDKSVCKHGPDDCRDCGNRRFRQKRKRCRDQNRKTDHNPVVEGEHPGPLMFYQDAKCCGKLAGHDEDEETSRNHGRDGEDKRDHLRDCGADDHRNACGEQGVAACILCVKDHARGDRVVDAAENTRPAGKHVHDARDGNAAADLFHGLRRRNFCHFANAADTADVVDD